MSLNVPAFHWSAKTERAAALLAEDALDDEAIAKECGVERRTIVRWKRHPAFIARIAEHVTAQREALKAEGIANRQNRIDRLNDHWQRMQRLVEARAAAATGEAPGDAEGLMARQVKVIGAGRNQRVVVEYAFDAALERELRAHEEQAAKELGQWVEKQAQTDPTGTTSVEPHAELVSRLAGLIARAHEERDSGDALAGGDESPSP